jgi:hypothetical protein
MSVVPFLRRTLGLALLVAVAACGSSSPSDPDPIPPPPPPIPGFTLTLGATTLAALQGETVPLTVTIARSGGFAGPVTVTAEGLPTGATMADLTIPAGSVTAQASLVLTAGAVVGTSTVTLRGTAAGLDPRTATVALSITAPPAGGSYTMAVAPTAATVAAGANSQATVTLTRTGGFVGAVALTATTPAGVTVAFAPSSVTGTTSTATITVAGGTAAGVVQVTLRGTATGQPERTATIALTITAGGGGGGTGNVAWTFCESAGLPIWFAAQDGNGAWTRVTPSGQEYRFQVGSARGGVAYVTPEDAGTVLKVFYGTAAELQAQGANICSGRLGAGRTVSGTVANAPVPGITLATLGGVSGTLAGNTVNFTRIPSGVVDLVGGAAAIGFGGSGVTFTLQRMLLRRGLNPANLGSLGSIDFNGAESFAPATATATLTNGNGEFTALTSSYLTANGGLGAYYVATGGSGSDVTLAGVPGDKRQAGELHLFNISVTPSLDPNAGATRNVGFVNAAIANRTITFGPAMTLPTVTSLGGGRLQAVYPIQSAYNRYWIASFDQTTIDRRVDIEMTSGWFGGGGSVTLAMPDLSGVAGWNAAWALQPGTSTSWMVSGTGWTGGNGITSPPFIEGAEYISGTQRASITP